MVPVLVDQPGRGASPLPESVGPKDREVQKNAASHPRKQSFSPLVEESLYKCIGEALQIAGWEQKVSLSNVWCEGQQGFLVPSEGIQRIGSLPLTEDKIRFMVRSGDYAFSKGEGLMGSCWEANLTFWVDDVWTSDPKDYNRYHLAKECGIRCSFVVPFVVCGETLALLEFVSNQVLEKDEALLKHIQRGTVRALIDSQGTAYGALRKPSGEQSDLTINPEETEEEILRMLSDSHKQLRLRSVTEYWSIKRSDIILEKKLDEGSQGVVYRAQWRGLLVAAKTVKYSGSAMQEETQEFLQEISLLSRMRHPNLVLFLGACIENSPHWLLNEYLSGGSLEDLFYSKSEAQQGQPWRPKIQKVLRWATDLARALVFLHGCQPPVIHRDLKPSNLLLSGEGTLKVADFGLSKIVNESQDMTGTYRMTGKTGTLRYMAPEAMNMTGKYNEKVDIYSYGIILWTMCTGERPLQELGMDETHFSSKIQAGYRPDAGRITQEALRGLMMACWDSSHANRPSAKQLLKKIEAIRPPKNSQLRCATLNRELVSGWDMAILAASMRGLLRPKCMYPNVSRMTRETSRDLELIVENSIKLLRERSD